jgi:hypothetical protein
LLEPKTLKTIRLPDPRTISGVLLEKLVLHVRAAVGGGVSQSSRRELDAIVADIYGFSEKEMGIIQPPETVE